MAYQVQFTAEAVAMVNNIADRRIQRQVLQRAEGLAEEPEKQGSPLSGSLSGYRSLRTVGQRYRIIYWIETNQVKVVVIAVGLRRDGDRQDVYTLAQRLVRLGLIEPLEPGEEGL
jgi:mRNA interferase RelE/StbE